jgi:hypothetical protein
MTKNQTNDFAAICDSIAANIPPMMPARDIAAMIDTLLNCDCRFSNPMMHDDCRHDLRQRDMRDLLDRTDIDLSSDCPELLRDLLTALMMHPHSTELTTAMLLDNSLCPMHAIDYAICFDDDDPECAAIRAIHPSHDT